MDGDQTAYFTARLVRNRFMRQQLIVTVGDTEKFRIPFRRTAVARLKKRGKNGTPFVKNGRSVRPRYRFNLSRSPYVSLKKI